MVRVWGFFFLIVGLSVFSVTSVLLRLFWEDLTRAQRFLYLGILTAGLGSTSRGVELLWFHAHHPGPGGFATLAGEIIIFLSLLFPFDKRLQPPSQEEILRREPPVDLRPYEDVLLRSANNKHPDEESS